VALLDQTLLPERARILRVRGVEAMHGAIRRLAVRGAPAIGVAAGYGVVLGVRAGKGRTPAAVRRDVERVTAYLATSRPTAVNLFWALERMRAAAGRAGAELAGAPRFKDRLLARLLAEARAIHGEDRRLCAAIGAHGEKLVRSGWSVLTHCNAGALATGGSGTALAVIYAAREAGKRVRVFADETRPLLQGSRLTAWELERAGIDVTVICDGAAASVLASGAVQCVIVGADRIARNGDVANKIGTYGVAVLAREHGVPFYVAAPSTTFDLTLASGRDIPIEERSSAEVVARRGVKAFNPAFDVTPARHVSAIITEKGIIRPPYARSIARALSARTDSRSRTAPVSPRAMGSPGRRSRARSAPGPFRSRGRAPRRRARPGRGS
jgi:methylthioribose-1-phosphate isomerase